MRHVKTYRVSCTIGATNSAAFMKYYCDYDRPIGIVRSALHESVIAHRVRTTCIINQFESLQYGDFSIFQDSGRRDLGFLKFEIF